MSYNVCTLAFLTVRLIIIKFYLHGYSCVKCRRIINAYFAADTRTSNMASIFVFCIKLVLCILFLRTCQAKTQSRYGRVVTLQSGTANVEVFTDVCIKPRGVLLHIHSGELGEWKQLITSSKSILVPGFTHRNNMNDLIQLKFDVQIYYDEILNMFSQKVHLIEFDRRNGKIKKKEVLNENKKTGDNYDVNQCKSGFNQWWHNAPTTTRYVIIISVTVGAFAVIFLSCFFVLRLPSSGDKDSFLSSNKTASSVNNETLSDSQPGGIYVPCEGELDDVFGIKFSSEGYTLVELVDKQPCTSSPDSKRSHGNGNGSHRNLMEELLESRGRIPSTIKREKLKKMIITQI
ncbi:uncharacterized protein LOC130612420 [Hydractinia symbiolongicarpus]|uniref:uncharacterized protein LOC130612420 n=1 Tax=Hydractinia symbiolongicarpus TaxID=13093 RepID=UPI00254F8C21|nr:uncharacterized protein LOC130612420 [Hydractinia symbiolongicarpus]